MSIHHAKMVKLMKQLAPNEGYTESLLDGVTLMRANHPIAQTQALYEPSIVIVIQGRKKGMHGGKLYVYDAQHYLVLSVPLPFTTETQASEQEPMLGVVLRIDPTITAEIVLTIEGNIQATEKPEALYATRLDDKLQDATLRLLETLTSSVESRLLGPAIIREITYRVLTGNQGASLRATLEQGSHFGRIAKTLKRIHSQYHQDLDVTTLAKDVHLSVPAFHAHFKSVTMTSPIQYIKAIRLHQARLMMIRDGVSVSTASLKVGYESSSQFSREFKRLFGRPPSDETQHMKSLFSLNANSVKVTRNSVYP